MISLALGTLNSFDFMQKLKAQCTEQYTIQLKVVFPAVKILAVLISKNIGLTVSVECPICAAVRKKLVPWVPWGPDSQVCLRKCSWLTGGQAQCIRVYFFVSMLQQFNLLLFLLLSECTNKNLQNSYLEDLVSLSFHCTLAKIVCHVLILDNTIYSFTGKLFLF